LSDKNQIFKTKKGSSFCLCLSDKFSHAPTVMGKSRFIHPLDNRLCTVREHSRLMSYPDNFCFEGPIVSQFNQVGESVPPLLSKEIGKQLMEQIP
jgi:DNA (cytosine-5)-methyltransferase 1